jgi:hypothetical protein
MEHVPVVLKTDKDPLGSLGIVDGIKAVCGGIKNGKDPEQQQTGNGGRYEKQTRRPVLALCSGRGRPLQV